MITLFELFINNIDSTEWLKHEEDIEPKKYLLDVHKGIYGQRYQIWELNKIDQSQSPNDEEQMVNLKKLYIFEENELIKLNEGYFTLPMKIALVGVIFQSDDLLEVLEHLELITTSNKYNL